MTANNKSQFLKGCARVLVLRILAERPMYGYEISHELKERSRGLFELGQGTLYPMLYSLERAALIGIDREEDAPGSGRKRIYYRITPKGKKELERDLSIWEQVERGMKLVLRHAHEAG